MPKLRDESWMESFVADLEWLLGDGQTRPDARTLATLCRGLSEQRGARDLWVFAHVRGVSSQQEEVALLVASLFAVWHRGQENGQTVRRPAHSLGGSFACLRKVHNAGCVEKRFAALIDSHVDELAGRLQQGVALLRLKAVGVHWQNLLRDLTDWDDEQHRVQRRWAQDFWVAS